jgi:hypothetical protein
MREHTRSKTLDNSDSIGKCERMSQYFRLQSNKFLNIDLLNDRTVFVTHATVAATRVNKDLFVHAVKMSALHCVAGSSHRITRIPRSSLRIQR